MASEYKEENGKLVPVGGMADIVDGERLKPDCWYIVEGGEWVEVDFSDGIMLRVIYKRGNVKKCHNDNGDVVYIVRSGAICSHGSTIKEARDNLIYKIGDRDTSKYDDYTLDTEVTKAEAIQMYRVITGACEYGVRSFVEANDIPKSATIKQVIELTKGQYGNEQLIKFMKENR